MKIKQTFSNHGGFNQWSKSTIHVQGAYIFVTLQKRKKKKAPKSAFYEKTSSVITIDDLLTNFNLQTAFKAWKRALLCSV